MSQCLAFSFNENGNNLSRISLSLTPLYFAVSHTSKKFRSSCASPWNWIPYSNWRVMDLSSKLFSCIAGLLITCGLTANGRP